MSIFRCKMCGGLLQIEPNQTTAVCDYCGAQQTLPKLDSDRRAQLYDRANHFRRNSQFDKAMGIYETILNEDATDSEAYWSLILCRYGIDYVEDPSTHKRVPTVNRTQFTSIFNDQDYKSALRYADSHQRSLYEQEATAINEIQKGILAISQKEEPFDVFLCYKETDENGRRTPDSVLANELYHQLTNEGFHVFFSRITLEDKIGAAYEPYIFAALHSAKVMVVLGTKPAYFNAAWVKNEWSRYLSLIKNGAKKVLIPAYRDMNPYDLPEEFSHLQALDMGKLGFMLDLIHSIKKLTDQNTPSATASTPDTGIPHAEVSGAVALVKRAFLFLEDGDWQNADSYCERALDIDPENGEAYLGKLMVLFHAHSREELKTVKMRIEEIGHYQKALRFGDDTLRAELTELARICRKNAAEERQRLKRANEQRKKEEKERQRHNEMVQQTLRHQQEQKRAEAARKKQKKRRKKIFTVFGLTLLMGCIVLHYETVILPGKQYEQAIALIDSEQYPQAIDLLETLGEYSDAPDQRQQAYALCYAQAEEWLQAGYPRQAAMNFGKLGSYQDAKARSYELWNQLARRDSLCAGENFTVALCSDGTILSTDADLYGQCQAQNWTDLIAVSAGGAHTVALRSDSTVWAAGDEADDQCDVQDWTDIVAVSAGDRHTVGLSSDGTAVATGLNDSEQCDVQDWNGLVDISAGGSHTMGLRADGTVVATGLNNIGQCDVQTWSDIIAVSAGWKHTVGLSSDGTVVATGLNYDGRCDVQDWTDIVAVSAGWSHTVGLRADGTVVATGLNYDGRCDVQDWTDIVAVSAGRNHTVGLRADGTVVATGANQSGQCDVETWAVTLANN